MLHDMKTFSIILAVSLSFSLNSLVVARPAAETTHVHQLPESLKPYQCHESDPNLNDCILKGVQYGIANFKTGLKEIGLPVLDPTEVKKANFNFDNDLIKGQIELSDTKISGLSDVKLSSINMKRNGNAITMITEGVAPKILVKGNHRGDVFFNNAKISSKGSFELILSDVTFKVLLDDELYEKDGHMYIRTKHVDLQPTIGDMKLKATGIFEDKELNDAIVDFSNKNWRDFYKIMIEQARPSWEPPIIEAANSLHARVPFDLLILKD